MDERSKEFASLPSAAAACVIFNMFQCVCVCVCTYIHTLPSGMYRYACKRAYRVAQYAWQQQQQQQQQPFRQQSRRSRETDQFHVLGYSRLNNADSQ